MITVTKTPTLDDLMKELRSRFEYLSVVSCAMNYTRDPYGPVRTQITIELESEGERPTSQYKETVKARKYRVTRREKS